MVVRTGYSSRCNAKQSLLLHCFGVVTAVRAGAGHYSRCNAKQLLLLHCFGVVMLDRTDQNRLREGERTSSSIICHLFRNFCSSRILGFDAGLHL